MTGSITGDFESEHACPIGMWQPSSSPSLTILEPLSNRAEYRLSIETQSPFNYQSKATYLQTDNSRITDVVPTSELSPFRDIVLRRSESVPVHSTVSERQGFSPVQSPLHDPGNRPCLDSKQQYSRCQSFEAEESTAYPDGEDLAPRIASYLAQLLRLQSRGSGGGRSCKSPEQDVFRSEVQSASALLQFVQRVSTNMRCSAACYVLAGIYINRLLDRTDSVCLTVQNIARLYFTALVLGVKYLDDQFFTNRYYCERCADIGVVELRLMEMTFLRALNYELFVSSESFAAGEAIQAAIISSGLQRLVTLESVIPNTLPPSRAIAPESTPAAAQLNPVQREFTLTCPPATQFVATPLKGGCRQHASTSSLQMPAIHHGWCHNFHHIQLMAQGTQIVASTAAMMQIVTSKPREGHMMTSSLEDLQRLTSNAPLVGAIVQFSSPVIHVPLRQAAVTWVPAPALREMHQHMYRPITASQIPIAPCRAYVSCWQTGSCLGHSNPHWNHQALLY